MKPHKNQQKSINSIENLKLAFVSKSLTSNPIHTKLSTSLGDLTIIIHNQNKSEGLKKSASFIIMELWNEYIALQPSELISEVPLLFSKYRDAKRIIDAKIAENEVLKTEINLLLDERKDLKLWIKIYRFALFVIIMGIISYAFKK